MALEQANTNAKETKCPKPHGLAASPCLANAHTCGIPSLHLEGPEYLHQVFPSYKPSQKEGELARVMGTTQDSGAATTLSVALH